MKKSKLLQEPKILLMDIETSPIVALVWSLFKVNISLNQIQEDWYVMSWAAKWLSDKPSKIMYEDQQGIVPQSNDKVLLEGIHKLLCEADIIITHNGKSFDLKKLNARFILNGMKPITSVRHIDTLLIAKKHFKFTSNKLAYLTDKLCNKHKKLDHGKFAGMRLWTECMADNPKAWKEMKDYNLADVLSLEELYYKLIPYDNSLNFDIFHDGLEHICKCGSKESSKAGFFFSNTGKFQRYVCNSCGHETRDKENLLSKFKKMSLRVDSVKS